MDPVTFTYKQLYKVNNSGVNQYTFKKTDFPVSLNNA
jgi:hypothetical protein